MRRPPRHPWIERLRLYLAGLLLAGIGVATNALIGFPPWVGLLWAAGVTGLILWDTWEG